MARTVVIGTWHEPEAREFSRCPSYYAADTETLRVEPGDYQARVTFEGGYNVPMPYWLLVGIECTRVSGRLYSGFGGVNFGSTELKAGELVRYCSQMYSYQIPELVKSGKLTLDPKFEWLMTSPGAWQHPDAPKTWADVAALEQAS